VHGTHHATCEQEEIHFDSREICTIEGSCKIKTNNREGGRGANAGRREGSGRLVAAALVIAPTLHAPALH
jgi:hypothetical protein